MCARPYPVDTSRPQVKQAVRTLFPDLSVREIKRAFHIADDDGSGELDEIEFKMVIGFIIYFNGHRHAIQELSIQVRQHDIMAPT